MYLAVSLKPFEVQEVDDFDDSDGSIIIEMDSIPTAEELAAKVNWEDCDIIQGEDLLEVWAFEYTG